MFAIEAAHQANVEELQKKILLKQEESKRRHEENIGQIRARAFELSVRRGSSMVGSDHAPALSPYRVKKMCSLCNLIIGSEVYLYSHLRSKKHQEAIQGLLDGVEPSKDQLECYNLKYIVDATNMADSCSVDVKVDKETLKAINKTRKKLRQRLLVKGRILEENWKNGDASIEINSPNKQTLHKIMSKIQSLAKENSPKSPWSGNDALALERLLNQLIKLVSLKNKQDLEYIFRTGAVPVFISFLCPLLELSNDKSPLLPEKIYALLCTILKEICANHLEICYYLLSSTFIISLLDLLALRLTLFSEESATVMSSSFSSPTLPSSNASVRTFDPVCSSLSILLSTIIRTLSDHAFVPWNDNPESFRQRVSDMISYSISIGIVDKLSLCIANSQGLVNSEQDLARQLRNSLSFIVCLTMLLASIKNFGDLFSQIEPEDNTQFIITLRMTHMVGVIPLMYGALLNTGSTLRPQSPTPESPEHVLELALESLQLLNYFALLDLKMLQTILGSEGLSLQLRHIANYLIWYCTHWEADSLLHEVILLIGFFTVDNVDNQNIVHTGQRPTILEQLCSLPYEFFSGSNLSRILLPTLISCCYENEVNCQILEQEVSSTILSSFIDKEIINNQVKATLKRKSLENLIESRVTNDRWSLKLRFPQKQVAFSQKIFREVIFLSVFL